LFFKHFGIVAAAGQQFFMRARVGDPVVFQHDDLVELQHRVNPVRDDDGRPVGQSLLEIAQNLAFRVGVYRRQAVVEQHDPGLFGKCPRDTDALFLSAGQGDAPLAHQRIIAFRQTRDVAVNSGAFCKKFRLLACEAGFTESNVALHRVGKQEHVLRHVSNAPAQLVQVVFAQVFAVQQDTSLGDIVHAQQEVGNGCFAGAGTPHNGHLLPRK